jgi:sugar transferase (PEP-CTERM system associated)
MIRIFNHYISKAYLLLLGLEFGIFFTTMIFSSKIFALEATAEYSISLESFVFAAVVNLSCIVLGLYRRSLNSEDYSLIRRMSFSFFIAFLITTQIYYFFPRFLVTHSILYSSFFCAFLGMTLSRFLFYKFVNTDYLKRRILIIGGGEKAHRLAKTNHAFLHKGFTIVGFFVLPEETLSIDASLSIQANHNLLQICENLNIDEIVITLEDPHLKTMMNELLDCKMSGIAVLDIINFHEREKGILSLVDLYPNWLIYSDGFSQSMFRTFCKRGFDIFASLLLLSVSWFVMVITAFAISWESGFKGSVIYKQQRVGENNKLFNVLKFRSMRLDAEKNGAQWAQQNDNRVTKVGSFIRKYRIDELPQIFNVLNGEMSFVGPRPERPEFVSGFEERIPYYRERHRVKPGITGWAQLCYPYGANEEDTIQKLQYDLYYVKNYSLFLDFFIMISTVEIILWGKGAR